MGQKTRIVWQGLLFLPVSFKDDNRAVGFWVVKRLDYKTESLHVKWMLI